MIRHRDLIAQYKDAMKSEPAKLEVSSIKIGFFGETGSGKSVTAAIYALGVTPSGRIGYIDGEAGRSGWAIKEACRIVLRDLNKSESDLFQRFEVLKVEKPFDPLKIVAALQYFEDKKDVVTVICDVMSQAWDSEGGYLDQKEESLIQSVDEAARVAKEKGWQFDEEKQRQKSAQSAAAKIKPWTHSQMVHAIDASPLNLVLLFQAKNKWNVKTNKVNEAPTAISESGVTRLCIACGRIFQKDGKGGFVEFLGNQGEGMKYTVPDILEVLPKNGEQFSIRHAQAIRALCQGGPEVATPAAQPPKKKDLDPAGSALWDLCPDKARMKEKGVFEKWLKESRHMGESENLANATQERKWQIAETIKAGMEG